MRIILDANQLTTKENAHVYLKEKLDFPEYYGSNLDALCDCLGELENDLVIEIENYSEEIADTYIKHVIMVMENAEIMVVYS